MKVVDQRNASRAVAVTCSNEMETLPESEGLAQRCDGALCNFNCNFNQGTRYTAQDNLICLTHPGPCSSPLTTRAPTRHPTAKTTRESVTGHEYTSSYTSI
jgi:hypothetical protein